jgi:hypothetical protein
LTFQTGASQLAIRLHQPGQSSVQEAIFWEEIAALHTQEPFAHRFVWNQKKDDKLIIAHLRIDSRELFFKTRAAVSGVKLAYIVQKYVIKYALALNYPILRSRNCLTLTQTEWSSIVASD